jgi:hypothetical protein
MADLGVALTWIAISAASVKGLSAFARAAITESVEAESTPIAGDGPLEGRHSRVVAGEVRV